MKRIIILVALLSLIVPPLLAKYISDQRLSGITPTPTRDVAAATEAEIIAAIKRKNNTLQQYQKFNSDFSLIEHKRITQWWYIAMIQLDGLNQSLILSKFTNEPDATRVVTLPGHGIPYFNTSAGLGIPYEVIDEYNDHWVEDHE